MRVPQAVAEYPYGPVALPADRSRRLERIEVRALEELEAFTEGTLGAFRDLPRGTTPPWRWRHRRSWLAGPPGDIVLAPARFSRSVLRATGL